MANLTIVEAVNQALQMEMDRDPTVVVLGEDVGRNGGVFRVTDGLQARFGEARVFDTPLAESGIIGTSVGMAVAGLRPVAEIQFMGFLYVCMNQIASQAARMRFRSGGRFTCPLVIRAPHGGGVRTPELHEDSLEALFVHTPGIKVVAPSTPADAKGLLAAAVEDPDPVLFLEHMKIYRAFRAEVPEERYTIPLGQAAVVRPGRDVSVFAWGAMVHAAATAAAEVEKRRGCSIELIDLRTLSPLDQEAIVASVERTGRAVVVQEAVRSLGVAAEVTAIIQERAFYSLQAPIARVTGYDTPFPTPAIEDWYVPSPERIAAAIDSVLDA